MQLEDTSYLDREIHQHCSQFVEQVRLLAPVDRVAVVLYDQDLSSSRVAFDWRTEESPHLNEAVSAPAECPEKKVLNLPLYGGEGRIGAALLHSQAAMSLGRQETQMVYRISEELGMRLENAELSRRIHGEAAETSVLDEIARIVTSAPEFGRVFNSFVAALKELIDFQRIAINFIDLDRGCLTKRYLAGSVNPRRPVGNDRFHWGGQTQHLIDHGRTLIRDDINKYVKYRRDQSHLDAGLLSSIAVPIFSQTRIIGTISLRSQSVAAYGRREQEILERLAERIAPALKNTVLTQRLQAREEELAASDEIARIITSAPAIDQVYERFAIELQRLVEFGWMNINFINIVKSSLVNKYLFGEERPDRYAGAVRLLKGTFAEKVLASGQTLISQLSADSDSPVERELVEYGVKTSITLPLVSKGQIIAVIGLRSHLADAYGPREQEILERLANQIAPAVTGAQLAEQQKARQAGVSTGEGGSGRSTSRHADLAHTLRSPLTSIKGYTSSLLRTDVAWSAELEREFLETIDREADRLNQAVSDLLDKSLDRDLPG